MTISEPEYCSACGRELPAILQKDNEQSYCVICAQKQTEYETKQVGVNPTRRKVLKTLGGGLMAGFGGSFSYDQRLLSSTPTSGRGHRQAFVTLPGLSAVSTLLNLPHLMRISDGPPIIIMDTYDYKRLRTKPQKEKREKKTLYLGLAFDDLRQRGILRLVDYSNYYSRKEQKKYLQQNKELITAMPNWLSQKTAKIGVKGWGEYTRGAYQEPFRGSLGEDKDVFSDRRQSAKKRSQGMDRGTGDHAGWTEKFLNKCITALVVRDNLDRNSHLNVCQIIGGPEYHMLGDLLNAARTQPCEETTIDLLDVGCGIIDTDVSYLRELEPNKRVRGLNPQKASQTREALDAIGNIVTDMAGIQYDDWHILGTSFVLPEYQNLFNYEDIRTEVYLKMDDERLAEETAYIIDILKRRTEESHSWNKIQYQSEYISETYNTISPRSPLGGTDIVECALNISHQSRELRAILDQGNVSQTAVFLATSIINNPTRRYNEDDVYRRAVDLMNRIDPSPAWENRLEKFRQEEQVETYLEHEDWFEMMNQKR